MHTLFWLELYDEPSGELDRYRLGHPFTKSRHVCTETDLA